MCEIYTYDSKHHQKVMEVTVTYTTTKSFLLSYLAINTQVEVRTLNVQPCACLRTPCRSTAPSRTETNPSQPWNGGA